MSEELKTFKAGAYTLVARSIDMNYRGVMWAAGEIVVDIQRATLEEVWGALWDALYEKQISVATTRINAPTPVELAKAFANISHQLSPGHKAMLRAHLKAVDNQITATQLAKAAGYANFRAANLQYGLVGAMLFAELPIVLPTREDGSAVMTCTIAQEDDLRESNAEHWIWKMRPNVAEGLAASGIL